MPTSTNPAPGAGLAKPIRPRFQDAPARRRACILPIVLALAATSSAQETPTRPDDPRSTTTGAHSTVATSPGGSQEAAPSDAEIASMRADANGQLRAINPSTDDESARSTAAGLRAGAGPTSTTVPTTTTESAADKQLRELLQERLRLLDEYDKAAASFKKAAHPEPNPEQRANDARGELVRLQAQLAQAAKHPEVLLPPAFSGPGANAGARPAVSAEIKEALEATTGEVKEYKAKLESLRTEVANWEGLQNARRADRDKLFQVVAAMKARGADREEPKVPSSATSSSSAPARRLVRERQVNAEWKSRAEAMRLQTVEAQIALEAKLVGVRELAVQVGQLKVQVAEKTLELMQGRYNAAAEQQERVLKEKAAAEESKARRSDDPLERFRAHRQSDLLELEAQVVKLEQALATAPPPSLEEQRSLADHTETDFALIKELLDDGQISRLDAIRLNNDFRRIGPERDRLLRNELAIAEARLQYYEDALTGVEIELLQDSLHDRYEHDMLRERLSPSRWAEGEAMVAGLERSHRAMLVRRRTVLERLNDCTAQTLDQITRRLAILDEEYGFIRTHIFWVRDQEPIGLGTITQGARECQHVAKALMRLAQESANPQHWGRRSAEFVSAAMAALVLPIGLIRLRRMLRSLIARDLPTVKSGAS
jgi:hypothetical protein